MMKKSTGLHANAKYEGVCGVQYEDEDEDEDEDEYEDKEEKKGECDDDYNDDNCNVPHCIKGLTALQEFKEGDEVEEDEEEEDGETNGNTKEDD